MRLAVLSLFLLATGCQKDPVDPDGRDDADPGGPDAGNARAVDAAVGDPDTGVDPDDAGSAEGLHLGPTQIENPCSNLFCEEAPSATFTVHDAIHASADGATVHVTSYCSSTVCGACPPDVRQVRCRTDTQGQCTVRSSCSGNNQWGFIVDDVVFGSLDYVPAANHE